MAINKVNKTIDEESFKFLENQSSILHTVDTNKITVNGVNVIVDKPKRGDVMCITKYKENDVLLNADKQEVVWIDGLSIEPTQLSQDLEPVGICLVVKGNKALVRYKEEKQERWAASERWEIPISSIPTSMNGEKHSVKITLNGVENPVPFEFTAPRPVAGKADIYQPFVNDLNVWFLGHDKNYSVEFVKPDTDLPFVHIEGPAIDNFRIIINARFTTNDWKTIKIEEIGEGTRAIAKHIKAVDFYYVNNGFKREIGSGGGCCRAEYYDFIQENQISPDTEMTSIDEVPYGECNGKCPALEEDFTNNEYCQILRDNFATYDEYFNSLMVKCPCGAGGAIGEFPSGKENTYKLADCTFLDNTSKDGPKQEFLYPAAHWAASIDLNAPKLGKGNWWLPSAAEMCEIMRDITYGTSFWETNPDIINRVLAKLTSVDNSRWSMLSAKTFTKTAPKIEEVGDRWTSSKRKQSSLYNYDGIIGDLNSLSSFNSFAVSAITIYEF